MRKALLLASTALLSWTTMTSAHNPPGEMFFAVQFPDDAVPEIDGNLSDWDVVPVNPYTIANEHIYSPVFPPVGRGQLDGSGSDIQIRHLVGWNERFNKLYFMSEIFDNVHNVDRDDLSSFWTDDAWEVEVNAKHVAPDQQNLAGEPANNFSYMWVVPPLDGSYQFYRPFRSLDWLVDGTDWVEFGWDFSGEQFGESTYCYELAVTPIESLRPSGDVTAEEAVVHDLVENETIHLSITVGDFDEPCTNCELTSYQGFWTMTPWGCCSASNDFVLAEIEPALVVPVASAVEDVSWGLIKAGSTR